MRKAISLFLVFSMLLLSGNMFALERKGADIEIYKTTKKIEMKMEGTPWESTVQKGIPPDFRGELIAVKKDSILLLDRYSGADVTVDIRDIGVIKIVRKSKALLGFGLGLLIGGGSGALIGHSGGDAEPGPPSWTPWITAEQKALVFGILFGVLGAAIGGIAGAGAGKDKTIVLAGKSDVEIQEILEKLRKKARIKNIQ